MIFMILPLLPMADSQIGAGYIEMELP